MRNIQIGEETYRFLQSKAIPFEEQPDDTIRRLLQINDKDVENQSSRVSSKNSNEVSVKPVIDNKTQVGSQVSGESFRDFYSNASKGSYSNNQLPTSNNTLNNSNSNKSLELEQHSNELLENNSKQPSNSNSVSHSNSNLKVQESTSSKVDSHSLFAATKPAAATSVPASEKYSNISNSTNAGKGKKKPKTSLPELVRAGLLQENERVYFQNYRGVKFPQYEVTIADGQLKWNNNRYSMSDLASKLLKDQDPTQDNDFVRGPVLWGNAAGKTIAELWDVYLAKKGV